MESFVLKTSAAMLQDSMAKIGDLRSDSHGVRLNAFIEMISVKK